MDGVNDSRYRVAIANDHSVTSLSEGVDIMRRYDSDWRFYFAGRSWGHGLDRSEMTHIGINCGRTQRMLETL